MQIVDFEDKHLPDILKVENECFLHPWTENMFKEEISGRFSRYRVAEIEASAVAYMGMWVLADEGHITNVAVAKDFRRRGIAKALISDFISFADEKNLAFLTLEVRKSNISAISLYKSFGFCEVGVRKKYYDNTEDAVLMTKFFKEVK